MKTWRLNDEVSLRTGLGVRYVGSTISTGVAGTLKTPSYTLADALVAVDWNAWSLSVNATNLFDKTYYSPCRAFGDCFTGNGRNVIATLGYRF
ncbi:MAG: TonB-dependent receptor [Caulobacteraceae bacterium]|nr:MAG: TonB-dependent receptor [Caulobacteraceae bacterium]